MSRTLVIDIDGVLCPHDRGDIEYQDLPSNKRVVEWLQRQHMGGNRIILHTARGMRTYNNDVSAVEKYVRPVLERWLERHHVSYDQLVMGKPWAQNGWYIDDRALRPAEALNLSAAEIELMVQRDRVG